MSIAPGWYVDPADPDTQRYWDGEEWLGDSLPAVATPPPGPLINPTRPEPAASAITPYVTDPTAPGYYPPGYHPPAPPPPGYYTNPGPAVPPPPGYYGYPVPPPPTDQTESDGKSPAPPVLPYPAPPGHPAPPGYPVPPGYPNPSGQHLPPGYPYPYPYPTAPAVPRPHGLTIAPPGKRLVARLIDIGILLLISVAVNGVLIYRLGRLVYEQVQAGPAAQTALTERGGGLEIAICLLTAALWAAYEIPQLATSGQTVGKRLMGIKVMRLENDQPLGFRRAFRRWWGIGWGTFFWPCFGIGFLFQFVDCLFVVIDHPLNQALHDRTSATVVVHVGRRGKNKEPGHSETDPAGTDPRA